MSTLTTIKTALRISHDAMDAELQGSILAAEQRLRMVGVNIIDEDDALTLVAIELYAKGIYNYQGDGERYAKAFDELSRAMALSGDYNGGGCDV